VNLYTSSRIVLLKDAGFSYLLLNGHTVAQNVACAGTHSYRMNTSTYYVMILNYLVLASLQIHNFARSQCKCKVPVHDVQAYEGVEV
jgi:hypothetical protein